MAYTVALIQNESELLRYSHADIRPALKKYNYKWTYYTAENIESLFQDLFKYDSIVLATNACNDKVVLDALIKNKVLIEEFLQKPEKGLLIVFQMRLTDTSFESYPFLPEDCNVNGVKRLSVAETCNDGDISFSEGKSNHIVLNHPNKISTTAIKSNCESNSNTAGLYWGYIEPVSSNFDILIKDSSFDPSRPLMVVSNQNSKARVVISSIVLDWQLHDRLWENVLRFVVEGPHLVAIITKQGNISLDIEHLKAMLKAKKIAYDEHCQKKLNVSDIPLSYNKMLIFDTAFTGEDVESEILRAEINRDDINIFFFQPWLKEGLAFSVYSKIRDFDSIAKNTNAWLHSLYSNGLWEESFWRTVDILGTFHYLKEPIHAYMEATIEAVERKRQSDGTYDNVFGATCAMLLVYHWFGLTEQEKPQQTKEWILSQIDKTDLFNQANAIETLVEVSPGSILESTGEAFRNSVITKLDQFSNLLELQRFCTTLISLNFIEEAIKVIKRLLFLQKHSGNINLYSIAETTFVLIQILFKSNSQNSDLQNEVFSNVQILKETFNAKQSNWKNNAITTAKALKALRAFEEMMSFPAESLLSIITDYRFKDNQRIAVDLVVKRNKELLERGLNDKKQIRVLQEGVENFRALKIAIIILTPATYLLFLATAALSLKQYGFLSKLLTFLNKWQDTFSVLTIPMLIIIPMLAYIYLLSKMDMLPKFLRGLLAFFSIQLEPKDEGNKANVPNT